MRISELTQIIESVVSREVRKTIIKESLGDKKEVYHVTCEGEPIDSFDTQEEAEKYIQDNKNSKKELLIDKKVYESHADMIEKLDQMGQELEEKENTNMENQEPMEGNAFVKAMLDAKEKGEKSFTVDGKEHDVEESWNQMEEEEMREEEECDECGGPTMEDVNEGTCEECGKELCECGSGMYESKKKKRKARKSDLQPIINGQVEDEKITKLKIS
jgi:ribosomal protein L37AE/L43A